MSERRTTAQSPDRSSAGSVRRLLAMAGIGGAFAAALIGPGTAAAQAESCPDVEVVFARGTAEPSSACICMGPRRLLGVADGREVRESSEEEPERRGAIECAASSMHGKHGPHGETGPVILFIQEAFGGIVFGFIKYILCDTRIFIL